MKLQSLVSSGEAFNYYFTLTGVKNTNSGCSIPDHPREFKLTNSIIIHLTKNVKEEVLTIYTILGTKLSEVGDQGGNEILFIARDPSILEATNGESAVAGPGNNGNTNNSAKTTDVVDSFSCHKENNGGAVAVISADFLKIGDTISFKVKIKELH